MSITYNKEREGQRTSSKDQSPGAAKLAVVKWELRSMTGYTPGNRDFPVGGESTWLPGSQTDISIPHLTQVTRWSWIPLRLFHSVGGSGFGFLKTRHHSL